MSRGQTIVAYSLATFGTLAMVVVIGHGFLDGNFRHEGRWLLDHPWGRVTLVDLYVGFLLFACWVFQRERSKLVATIWLISLLVLGHLAASVYIIMALIQSRNDVQHFWLGIDDEGRQ